MYFYSLYHQDSASQAGDADSFRAPGLTSGLQGSVNVHRGAYLLVPQWQCISSFVFYILSVNTCIDVDVKLQKYTSVKMDTLFKNLIYLLRVLGIEP